MATTVNVICYKSKTLSNGEHPIMVRISKDGKRKYVSVGISVKSEFWNFNKNEPKLNCPNREYINLIIANKKKEYEEEIIRLTSENKDFTANTLGENKGIKLQTVNEIFLEYIDSLKMEKRTGYMKSVQQVYNSLLEYHGHLNIHFSEINQLWLKRYEVWLHNKGLANNTVGIRFRTLRAIFNYAITKEVARREDYPFDKYKVSKLNEETAKRALSKTDITRIIRFKSSNRLLQFPIDIFAFTYYAGGINFVDIANLTRANLMEDRLVYKRQKTGKLIRVPLTQQAIDLISKYANKNNPYLFPIFSSKHKTEQEKANRLHKVITKVNRRLRQVGEELSISIPVTTYVARHSQATIMKKAGVATSVISQIMGHSSERVTQIYLDSFDNEQVNNAMKNLL